MTRCLSLFVLEDKKKCTKQLSYIHFISNERSFSKSIVWLLFVHLKYSFVQFLMTKRNYGKATSFPAFPSECFPKPLAITMQYIYIYIYIYSPLIHSTSLQICLVARKNKSVLLLNKNGPCTIFNKNFFFNFYKFLIFFIFFYFYKFY